MEYPHTKPPGCLGCPAYEYGQGFVPPVGPPDATVAVVGQGPGEQEAQQGVPFAEVAPSGHMLTRWLHAAGTPRGRVWLGNVVQCWLPEGYRGRVPYGNREPYPTEAAHCWQHHVGPAIHGLTNLQHILAIGTAATRWLNQWPPDESVERWLGTRMWVDLPPVTPVSPTID